ncbi:cupin domain-containing protein [Frankia sp. Cppng1_Ct_nod]|uniref:cupin domain-containing protein n=1 Tax=Frankia sp. Cppng1_Ct_nod TaxID=2897162 RepID=UPI0010410586|nr:cupin domain-containing protein [Frankia sp. Cppng1_Ct_nod]
MATIQVKNIGKPDERRDFPHGHVEAIRIEGHELDRAVFEPGWRWSESVRPTAGTESCEFEHYAYVDSGRMHIRQNDGGEAEIGPGDVTLIPAGHDAWVVGDEPCVMLDLVGAAGYARLATEGTL